MGISHGTGILEIPSGREILEAQEIPESRVFPWNSRMENSRERKLWSHTGGREWKFPVEHPWVRVLVLCSLLEAIVCSVDMATNDAVWKRPPTHCTRVVVVSTLCGSECCALCSLRYGLWVFKKHCGAWVWCSLAVKGECQRRRKNCGTTSLFHNCTAA